MTNANRIESTIEIDSSPDARMVDAELQSADSHNSAQDIPRSLCEAVGMAGASSVLPIVMLRGSMPGLPIYSFAESLGWPFSSFASCASTVILLLLCIVIRLLLVACANKIQCLKPIKTLWIVGAVIGLASILPLPSLYRITCVSCSYAVTAFLWRFATLNKSITKQAFPIKNCCMALFVCIGCLLPSSAVPAFVSGLLIISSALFFIPSGLLKLTWVYVPHEAKKGVRLYSSRMVIAVSQLPNAFAMGTIFCILAKGYSAYLIGIAFAASYVLCIIVSKAFAHITRQLMRALYLTCSIACLAFIPYSSNTIEIVLALVMIIITYSFLTYYDWIHASMPKDDHLADVFFISLKGTVEAIAMIIGFLAAVWAFSFTPNTVQAIGVITGILMIATCICILYTMGGFKKKGESQKTIEEKLKASAPLDTWEERVMIVAEKYGLTPRQTEILNALSRGRNAQYIMGRLYLSEGSVKKQSHLIYKKLDVHNQQDLITLVMEARSDR